MSGRLHSPIYQNQEDDRQNYSVYENGDRHLRPDSGPYSPGDWSDSTFSRIPDDPTGFYTVSKGTDKNGLVGWTGWRWGEKMNIDGRADERGWIAGWT